MSQNQKNRYPGTQPFTAEQKNLFHGRNMETDDLLKLIRFQQMVVLYGKSGLGKSSLLNASIKPKVEERKIAEVFAVRFNALNENKTSSENKTDAGHDSDTPVEKTFAALMPATKSALEAANDNSLWFAAKARQLIEKKKSFLLVFDQFEELFTYSESDIENFKNQLSELLRSGLPKRFEDKIKSLQLSDDDLDVLYEPADIKVLFAIRSDRMHYLDKLSDVLPDILRHCYELNALVEADARNAITIPAETLGDYDTPTFSYAPQALNNIVNFLKEKDENGRIEAIQLQTLCQAFERKITQSGQTITDADTLPEKLKVIIDEYYNTQLNDDRIVDKDLAHRLIEDELVIDTGDGKGVRVTLHELSLKAKFAKGGQAEEVKLKKLLEALVNVHLLRREVGSRGGDTYELSHDRLIEPVLKSKAVYLENENRKRIAAENAAREKELAEANQRAADEAQKRIEAERLRQEADEQRQIAISQTQKAKKQRRLSNIFAVLASIGLIGAMGLAYYANTETKKAEDALKNFKKAQFEKDLVLAKGQLSGGSSCLSDDIYKKLSDALKDFENEPDMKTKVQELNKEIENNKLGCPVIVVR